MEIEVVVSQHIEAELDETGEVQLSYDYHLIRFVTDELVLVARRYADEPEHAHFLRFEAPDGAMLRGLVRDDLGTPIVRLAVGSLRRAGAESVRWITAEGYDDVPD